MVTCERRFIGCNMHTTPEGASKKFCYKREHGVKSWQREKWGQGKLLSKVASLKAGHGREKRMQCGRGTGFPVQKKTWNWWKGVRFRCLRWRPQFVERSSNRQGCHFCGGSISSDKHKRPLSWRTVSTVCLVHDWHLRPFWCYTFKSTDTKNMP